MKTRGLLLVVALAAVIVVAGTAHAQPGTAYLRTSGGAMMPIGDFDDVQDQGWAYSILAGYEFIDFFDLTMEFTHSFNDNDNEHRFAPGVSVESDETHQSFVIDIGPRINFVPAHYLVKPYGMFQVGWYHFANFNSVKQAGSVDVISDEDDDAVGIEAGLGVEGTIFQLYENKTDEIPMFDLALGVHASYHHAFRPGDTDNQFITTMGSVTMRF